MLISGMRRYKHFFTLKQTITKIFADKELFLSESFSHYIAKPFEDEVISFSVSF